MTPFVQLKLDLITLLNSGNHTYYGDGLAEVEVITREFFITNGWNVTSFQMVEIPRNPRWIRISAETIEYKVGAYMEFRVYNEA